MAVYEPYERLVPITVLGQRVEVPENNVLLRCFQYLCPDSVPYGRFCWNDECGNCELKCRAAAGEAESRIRGCQFRVTEGLEVTEVGIHLKLALYPLLEPEPAPGWPAR